jgi:hypothetical protein
MAVEGKPAQKVFEEQRRLSVEFHKSVDAYIDKQTEPSTHFPPTGAYLNNIIPRTITVFGKTAIGLPKYTQRPANIGGIPMNEWRLDSFESVSAAIAQGHHDLLDWGGLRRRIKNDSTVIGEAMISQWMKAPS